MLGPVNVDVCGAMTPVQIGTYGNSGQPKATDVATDGNAGWILLSTGDVWALGQNNAGQLGNGNTTSGPTLVKFNIGTEKATSLATDFWTAMVTTQSGKVFGAGYNLAGDLGAGDRSTHSTPVQFPLPSGELASSVLSVGNGRGSQPKYYSFGNNAFVLTQSGNLYASGDNYYGQLGIGSASNSITTPQKMVLPTGVTAKDIRAGGGTAIVLGSNNLIYSIGNNNYGQLGDGTQQNSASLSATRYLNMTSTLAF
jgi:alpha-tubulin suppressor-like RCC1 family protein